jgi:hypothetical protein
MRASLDRLLTAKTYVGPSIPLGDFLRTLFGEERAEKRLRLATARPVTGPVRQFTDELSDPGLPLQTSTQSAEVSAPHPPTGATWQYVSSEVMTRVIQRRKTAVAMMVIAAIGIGSIVVAKRKPATQLEPAAMVEAPRHEPEWKAPPRSAPTRPTPELRHSEPSPPQREARMDPEIAAPPPGLRPTSDRIAASKREAKPKPPIDAHRRSASLTLSAPASGRPPPAVSTAPASGMINVESNIAAKVSLDGIDLGRAPVGRAKASAGDHVLQVESASLGVLRRVHIAVKPGEEATHRIDFHRGKLNVTVLPWADVWLDGQKIGQTPLAGREVWEGRHTLRLVGPQGEKTVAIEVVADRPNVVRETIP